jgi:hypothetical protein
VRHGPRAGMREERASRRGERASRRRERGRGEPARERASRRWSATGGAVSATPVRRACGILVQPGRRTPSRHEPCEAMPQQEELEAMEEAHRRVGREEALATVGQAG